MKLLNKIVLVTGATSGIGEACAVNFAKNGAKVIITGRNIEKGKVLANTITEKEHGSAEFYFMDISDRDSVIRAKKNILDKYTNIDILVNNAGIYQEFKKFEELEEEVWEKIFNTNNNGTFYVTKEFFNSILNKRGVIINIASIAGMQMAGSGQRYAYAASKAAMIQFTRCLAKAYADKIRVNCVCPGVIDTPIYGAGDKERLVGKIPAKRLGSTDEVAKVVEFLASDDASYVNGAILTVDGGLTS